MAAKRLTTWTKAVRLSDWKWCRKDRAGTRHSRQNATLHCCGDRQYCGDKPMVSPKGRGTANDLGNPSARTV